MNTLNTLGAGSRLGSPRQSLSPRAPGSPRVPGSPVSACVDRMPAGRPSAKIGQPGYWHKPGRLARGHFQPQYGSWSPNRDIGHWSANPNGQVTFGKESAPVLCDGEAFPRQRKRSPRSSLQSTMQGTQMQSQVLHSPRVMMGTSGVDANGQRYVLMTPRTTVPASGYAHAGYPTVGASLVTGGWGTPASPGLSMRLAL